MRTKEVRKLYEGKVKEKEKTKTKGEMKSCVREKIEKE